MPDHSPTMQLNPRTARVRRIIIDAAIEVLQQRGAGEVTTAQVAEQAGVARTTIYRQWPDQRSLLLATIDALTAPHGIADARATTLEVRQQLQNLRRRLALRDVRSVFGALAARSASDEVFAAAQHRFVQRLIEPLRMNLEAGQKAGALAPEVDCEFEANALAGAILHQYLVLHEEVPDALIDQVVVRWQATQPASGDPTQGAH